MPFGTTNLLYIPRAVVADGPGNSSEQPMRTWPEAAFEIKVCVEQLLSVSKRVVTGGAVNSLSGRCAHLNRAVSDLVNALGKSKVGVAPRLREGDELCRVAGGIGILPKECGAERIKRMINTDGIRAREGQIVNGD